MIERSYIIDSIAGFMCGKHPMDAIITPDGEIRQVSFTGHIFAAKHIVRNNGWEDEYAASNKNRAYDAVEFLIIVKGYITIHQGHFRFSTNGRTTTKQKIALECDPQGGGTHCTI